MSNDAKVRAWRFYVEDMLIFCDKALRYMHGVERTSFALDPMRYDATLRKLELIGEAATHVPAEVREGTPDILGGSLSRAQSLDSWLPGRRR